MAEEHQKPFHSEPLLCDGCSNHGAFDTCRSEVYVGMQQEAQEKGICTNARVKGLGVGTMTINGFTSQTRE
jgi:hypothetical protein